MTKIGITGGKGLIGSLLVKKLKKKKIKYSLFNENISDKKSIRKWLKFNKKIIYIFHFAAISSEKKCKKNIQKAINVNIIGTQNLLNEIKKSKRKIWLFFASSSHVYSHSDKNISENFKKKPQSFYGKTKLLAEKKIINNKSKFFSFFIARIFSIYHKDQKKPFLYPSIKKRIEFNKKSKIFIKNANCIRDFLNAEKLINIIYRIYKKKLTGVYNIGSGKGTAVKKFLEKELKLKKRIITNNHVNRIVCNNYKLKYKLNEK